MMPERRSNIDYDWTSEDREAISGWERSGGTSLRRRLVSEDPGDRILHYVTCGPLVVHLSFRGLPSICVCLLP